MGLPELIASWTPDLTSQIYATILYNIPDEWYLGSGFYYAPGFWIFFRVFKGWLWGYFLAVVGAWIVACWHSARIFRWKCCILLYFWTSPLANLLPDSNIDPFLLLIVLAGWERKPRTGIWIGIGTLKPSFGLVAVVYWLVEPSYRHSIVVGASLMYVPLIWMGIGPFFTNLLYHPAPGGWPYYLFWSYPWFWVMWVTPVSPKPDRYSVGSSTVSHQINQ
jgi:hypothetical protein